MKDDEPCTSRGVSTVLEGVTPRPLTKGSMAWRFLPYELYTMQRYLQYSYLKENDFDNFDSWASTFGETQSTYELAPEGTGYRVRTRFSKFYNLPELMSMFKEVADIQTADILALPTPTAHYEVIKTKPSSEQKEILKSLSERADRVRNGSVDPKEDNMLSITNDGRKLALDQRLLNPMLPDNPDSKLNACVRNVYDIWEKTKANKSTQLLFSDISTPKSNGEFNIYDDIRDKLVAMGIPKEEIVFIHEGTTDEKREEIFSKVRKGSVRILVGSTKKMGAGTNIQDRLIANHDIDVPWRPADLEQRAGRIVRQGNANSDVYIYRYVTEDTFDAYLWQIIENKQRFISQIMTSKTPVRVAEDVDENSLSYAELKALATGNPMIKEKMELETQVTKLKVLEAGYKSGRYTLEDKVMKKYPDEIKDIEESIAAIETDMQVVEPKGTGDEKFTSITIWGEKIVDKKLAGEKLLEAISKVKIYEKTIIGNYRNMELEVGYNSISNEYTFSLVGAGKYTGEFSSSADGNIVRLDNALEKMQKRLERFKEKLEDIKVQYKEAKLELEVPFDKEKELQDKILRLAELNAILEMDGEIGKEDMSPEKRVFARWYIEKEIFLKDTDVMYLRLNSNDFSSSKSILGDFTFASGEKFAANENLFKFGRGSVILKLSIDKEKEEYRIEECDNEAENPFTEEYSELVENIEYYYSSKEKRSEMDKSFKNTEACLQNDEFVMYGGKVYKTAWIFSNLISAPDRLCLIPENEKDSLVVVRFYGKNDLYEKVIPVNTSEKNRVYEAFPQEVENRGIVTVLEDEEFYMER